MLVIAGYQEAGWFLLAQHHQVPSELDLTGERVCYNTSYYGISGQKSSLSSCPPERREVRGPTLSENPLE